MLKVLRLIGLALLLPGLGALGLSIYEGPESWYTDGRTFWGTPIALFVFWIGLAHAGTLLSAIFLALKVRLDRRTAMLAELSTLCSLCLAMTFPLIHLGVLENFYMVAPFMDGRGIFPNAGSPLVWDFCCIAVYGILSVLFFQNHLSSQKKPALEKIRKPLAWLLLPLVLWVHSVVSLDFATTFVPSWQGAFFPVYFVVGAIYSGLALVNALLCAEGFRVRMLERLMMVSSWIICIIWLWDFLAKDEFFAWTFVCAGVLPQLYWVAFVRDTRRGRLAVSLSILTGLFLERLYLVSPSFENVGAHLGWVDYGLISFSIGLFMLLFYGLRHYVGRFMEDYNTYFGEMDGSEMEADVSRTESANHVKEGYILPFSSTEFRVLRLPVLFGVLLTILFCIWCLSLPDSNLELVNLLPLTYPMIALVAGLSIWMEVSFELRVGSWKKLLMVAIGALLLGGVVGIFYAGIPTKPSEEKVSAVRIQDSFMQGSVTRESSALLWNSRCSSCHGTDGRLNEKFVREFYPVPTALTLDRLDSLGEDSLYQVVAKGRANMNPYGDRLTEDEIRGLVQYMRSLAKEVSE
ncbi:MULTISPECIES: c-type cytochrome [unclassified Fibrobacter]|uniref:c-type cytochrome n=1 Tax=unclassified Fibrobacter TaxID=2634177 RepID=UPI000D6C2FFF|nr:MULTISPECIES: c-type cytochrome [unclassified Fibrobacter]PWJ68496.1 polysulfide reductase NrfD [Fibrobacter sp. UWR4]PZW72112.1 polysulfide reductase NrfD [Fibrobacter sp. UWR1]